MDRPRSTIRILNWKINNHYPQCAYLLSIFLGTFITLHPVVSVPLDDNYADSSKAFNFLENYGYLPKSGDNNDFNLLSSDELRKSIKLMQKYGNIEQTGIIDNRTLLQMKKPRCGLPDVVSNSRRSKRFVIYGPKWKKIPITWSFTKPSRTVPSEAARKIFARALGLWSKASEKLKFVETQDPEADIRLGFYVGNHGCGRRQAFDGPGSKLAHAFGPPDGDVHFDDDEDWLKEINGISLYWTALHEFGHSLGFAHTADESSIMFPYYQDHGSNFDLPDVDKAGIRYLYGDLEVKQADKLPMPTRNKSTQTTTSKSEVEMPRCISNIDAIASIRRDIFIFKNNMFWWIKQDLSLVRQEPIPITQYFIGFPGDINKIDAVYERRSDQKIMFFIGKQYWLFSANQYYAGPKPLTDLGLPYNLDNVDDVTNWGSNGRAYIFAGPIYWRLDETENHVELDYPRDITVWNGIPNNIDAVFTWEFDSATYFFKGEYYWKFNNRKMSIDSNYPKLIHQFWFRSIECADTTIVANLHYVLHNSGISINVPVTLCLFTSILSFVMLNILISSIIQHTCLIR